MPTPRILSKTNLFILSIVLCFAASIARTEDNAKELTLDLGKGIKLDLVLITPGTFQMGTPEKEEGHKKSETLHTVTISKPYYMDKYEVTQEQYEAITTENPSKTKDPKLPVERVSWEDASKFCEKLTISSGKIVMLPTEAQWEYACRAGTTTAFNTGDTITSADSNFNGETKPGSSEKGENRDKTMPVGSFKPNAFGLFDMHGNVWEWCRDWYDENIARTAPAQDPEGPAKSSEDPPARSIRGGSYYSILSEVRCGSRDNMAPGFRSAHGGFRVVVQFEK